MSYTPGPWRRGIGSDANKVFDDQGRIVACRTGYDDGNLIAAVPKMLKALQAIAEDDPSGKYGRWAREALPHDAAHKTANRGER